MGCKDRFGEGYGEHGMGYGDCFCMVGAWEG